MLQNKHEIEYYCQNYNMIAPYNVNRLKSSSYDLSVGSEYYIYNKEDGKKAIIRTIEDNGTVCIPADGICYIITEETLQMPPSISAEISLSFGLIGKGIMLSNQPPIDPGYRGKIVALLHNLSSQDLYVNKGQHVLNIVFHKLSTLFPGLKPGKRSPFGASIQ